MKLEQHGQVNCIPDPPRRTCAAKTRSGGECTKPAGFGTLHVGEGCCKFHGGATPAHLSKAELAKARRETLVMGEPVDVDPVEAILECIRVAAGEMRYASQRIAELEPEAAIATPYTLTTRPLKLESGAESIETRVTEERYEPARLHLWIRVRHEAMDRLERYAKTAAGLGLDERLVRIAESQGRMFADAVRAILSDLGVADDPRAPLIVRRHLTAIDSTAEEMDE